MWRSEGLGGKTQQAIWDFEREAKNSKLAFVYTNALLARLLCQVMVYRIWQDTGWHLPVKNSEEDAFAATKRFFNLPLDWLFI
jgi:hypothetical protein